MNLKSEIPELLEELKKLETLEDLKIFYDSFAEGASDDDQKLLDAILDHFLLTNEEECYIVNNIPLDEQETQELMISSSEAKQTILFFLDVDSIKTLEDLQDMYDKVERTRCNDKDERLQILLDMFNLSNEEKDCVISGDSIRNRKIKLI